MKNEEKNHEDARLGQISRNLTFIHRSSQLKWISHLSERRRILFEVSTAANVLYCGTSLILSSFFTELKVHMGGILFQSAILAFSLVSFFLIIFGTKISTKLRKKINRVIDQSYSISFILMFYPILFLRCCGFLKFCYVKHRVDILPVLGQWESSSFYWYMVFWTGFPMIQAGVPFSLTVPYFVLSSFCFFFDAFLINTVAAFVESMQWLTLSSTIFVLVYFVSKGNISSFGWKIQYNRSVKREQERTEELHLSERENSFQPIKGMAIVFGEFAHDMGTPLAAISMSIDLLDSGHEHTKAGEVGKTPSAKTNLTQDEAEAFEAIRSSITVIQILRQSMIDTVKMTHGVAVKPALEEVDIETIIAKKVFPILRRLLGSKEETVTASWYVGPELKINTVLSSKNWLIDMLLNLISNAVKFTSTGTIEVAARLMFHDVTGSKMIIFEVKDTGQGVPKEKEEELFQIFGQCQSNKGGTGLGINSVKTKARLMGGDAGYRSNAACGSIFYFTIPYFTATPRRVRAKGSLPPNWLRSSCEMQGFSNQPLDKEKKRSKTVGRHQQRYSLGLSVEFDDSCNSSRNLNQSTNSFMRFLREKTRKSPKIQQSSKAHSQPNSKDQQKDETIQNILPLSAPSYSSDKPAQDRPLLKRATSRGSIRSSLGSIKENKSLSASNSTEGSYSSNQPHESIYGGRDVGPRTSQSGRPENWAQSTIGQTGSSRATSQSGRLSERSKTAHISELSTSGRQQSVRPQSDGLNLLSQSVLVKVWPSSRPNSDSQSASSRDFLSSVSYWQSGKEPVSYSESKGTPSEWESWSTFDVDYAMNQQLSLMESKSDECPIQHDKNTQNNKDTNEINVLVVDDSSLLLSLYSRLLKRCNVTKVVTAESGEECLDYFFGKKDFSQWFDLVLIDDQMTGLRGPDVARKISKGVPYPPNIYVCSGNSPEMIREDFPDADKYLKGILPKPVTFDRLKDLIQSLIKIKDNGKEAFLEAGLDLNEYE